MKKKSKKEIIRQCISCRTPLPKNCLIRLTKVTGIEGKGKTSIIVNPNKFELGRSVYLCKKTNCINAAVKGKKIAKMLKVPISLIDEKLTENIEKFIVKGGEKLLV